MRKHSYFRPLRLIAAIALAVVGLPLGAQPAVRPAFAANATVGTGSPASCTAGRELCVEQRRRQH
jgi:hypothetical protein